MIPAVQENLIPKLTLASQNGERAISPYRVAPERTRSEVIDGFVTEMMAPLVEPLASSLTTNPFEDEEGEEGQQEIFMTEMGQAAWGRVFVQGPAFQGLREALSQQIDLHERVWQAKQRAQRGLGV